MFLRLGGRGVIRNNNRAANWINASNNGLLNGSFHCLAWSVLGGQIMKSLRSISITKSNIHGIDCVHHHHHHHAIKRTWVPIKHWIMVIGRNTTARRRVQKNNWVVVVVAVRYQWIKGTYLLTPDHIHNSTRRCMSAACIERKVRGVFQFNPSHHHQTIRPPFTEEEAELRWWWWWGGSGWCQ